MRILGTLIAFVCGALGLQVAVVCAEVSVVVDGDARFLRSSVYQSLLVMFKHRGIALQIKGPPLDVVRIWVKGGDTVFLRQATLQKRFVIPDKYRTDDVRARAIVLFLELFQDMKESKEKRGAEPSLPGHSLAPAGSKSATVLAREAQAKYQMLARSGVEREGHRSVPVAMRKNSIFSQPRKKRNTRSAAHRNKKRGKLQRLFRQRGESKKGSGQEGTKLVVRPEVNTSPSSKEKSRRIQEQPPTRSQEPSVVATGRKKKNRIVAVANSQSDRQPDRQVIGQQNPGQPIKDRKEVISAALVTNGGRNDTQAGLNRSGTKTPKVVRVVKRESNRSSGGDHRAARVPDKMGRNRVLRPVPRPRSTGRVGGGRLVAVNNTLNAEGNLRGTLRPTPGTERRWWVGLEISGGGGLGVGLNEQFAWQGASGGRGWGQFSVIQGPRWERVSWLTLRTSLEVGGVPLPGQPSALIVRPSALLGALLPIHRVLRLHLELGGFAEFIAVNVEQGTASRWRGGLVTSVRLDVVAASWLTLFLATSYLFSPYRTEFLRRGQIVLPWDHSQLDFFLGVRFQIY